MINRNVLEFLQVFYTFAANVISFYFFVSRFSVRLDYSEENRNRNEKDVFLPLFARKRPFLSQIKHWFSVIYTYIGQFTPHPPVFDTRRVGQLSSEIFYFFIFYFFCKILRFYQFRFSTEFLAFLRTSYLLFFLHKVS